MYYKTRDPFNSFDVFAQKVNKIGTKILNEFENGVTIETGTNFTPRLDLIEESTQYVVFAELPGINKDDITIKVSEEGKLTLKGKKDKHTEIDGTVYHRTERTFGDFERTILIPDNANVDAVSAKFDNGVLAITIGKKEVVKPKETKIDIV